MVPRNTAVAPALLSATDAIMSCGASFSYVRTTTPYSVSRRASTEAGGHSTDDAMNAVAESRMGIRRPPLLMRAAARACGRISAKRATRLFKVTTTLCWAGLRSAASFHDITPRQYHMIDDEVIPPSDSEEEEEYRASMDGYWEGVAAAMTSHRAAADLPTRSLLHDAAENAEAGPSTLNRARNGAQSPPRKRRKVCHMRSLYLLILNSVIARPFRGKHSCSPSRL